MDITVKNFNTEKANKELMKCPKIVQNYVQLLKSSLESQKILTNKAINKLRNVAKALTGRIE